jgi:hypothetical protein
MDYSINLIRGYDNLGIDLKNGVAQRISQKVEYTIKVTYTAKYPLLDGNMPSNMISNDINVASTTEASIDTTSF